MAVQITVEFTDAQWDLVLEHYPMYIVDELGRSRPTDVTQEKVAADLFNKVQYEVVNCVRDNVMRNVIEVANNCFNV